MAEGEAMEETPTRDQLLADRARDHVIIGSAVSLLRQLGGMLPDTRVIVDTAVDLLASITEES